MVHVQPDYDADLTERVMYTAVGASDDLFGSTPSDGIIIGSVPSDAQSGARWLTYFSEHNSLAVVRFRAPSESQFVDRDHEIRCSSHWAQLYDALAWSVMGSTLPIRYEIEVAVRGLVMRSSRHTPQFALAHGRTGTHRIIKRFHFDEIPTVIMSAGDMTRYTIKEVPVHP